MLPVAALVVLDVLPAASRDTNFLHGISYLDAYLPILMTFSLCMCAVNFLPAVLVTYREQGILRRMSTTPVPPPRLRGAQLVIYLGVGLAVCAVLAVVGFTGFGVGGPRQIPAFVLSVVLIAIATLGIGLVVTAIAPHSRAANAAEAVLPPDVPGRPWVPPDCALRIALVEAMTHEADKASVGCYLTTSNERNTAWYERRLADPLTREMNMTSTARAMPRRAPS